MKSTQFTILYSQLKHWKVVLVLSFAIIAVAFFLRTYNLLSIPIFADEAIYVRWAQVMRAESTLRFLPLSDGKQPLFMWAAIPFLKVISDPLIASRLLSVCMGIASLAAVFLLTLRLFGLMRIALIAAVLYAVSPFSVFFDRMALVDSMLSSFGIWSLYLAVVTAQTRRLDFAMLTGFALGAAWLTKSPAIFFVLLLPTSILVFIWPKGKTKTLTNLLHLAALWLVTWSIAYGIYNILRLGPNYHMLALRNQDYIFTYQEVFKHPFDPLQFHLLEIFQWFAVLLPGTVLLAVIAGLAFGYKKYWREFLLLLAWIIGPLFIEAEFAKVFTARYILFTVPPLLVLSSFIFNKLKGKIAVLALLFLILPALYIDYLMLVTPEKAPLPRRERSGYLEEWTSGYGIREVAGFIKEEHNKNPDQQIIVGTEGYFGTLPDGLQIYIADIPRVVVKGIGVSISGPDESLIAAKKAKNKVYLVVNSTRFIGNAEEAGLQLLGSYPKAINPNGKQESLLFFEVVDRAVDIYNLKNAEKTEKDKI